MLLLQHWLAKSRTIEAQCLEVYDAFRLNSIAEFEVKTTEAEWSAVAKVANVPDACKWSVIMVTLMTSSRSGSSFQVLCMDTSGSRRQCEADEQV